MCDPFHSRSDPILEEMVRMDTVKDSNPPLTTWKAFMDFSELHDGWNGWAFRGQSDLCWALETSLRRHALAFGVGCLPDRELGMIRRFKREYRQYTSSVIEESDYIQWMSIMRHHGAPTRLLDITYSIFVALYFATIDSSGNAESAIWCLNTNWLDQAYKAIAPRRFKRELARDKRGIFINLYKAILNDRNPKVY